MQRLRQKRPRLKLSAEQYELLRQRELERDGWRCQNCGSAKDLQVHHLIKRSKLGDDAVDRLITLCRSAIKRSTTPRVLVSNQNPKLRRRGAEHSIGSRERLTQKL
jgi:5-methylcytosine-specific restriction endonuclease McrA